MAYFVTIIPPRFHAGTLVTICSRQWLSSYPSRIIHLEVRGAYLHWTRPLDNQGLQNIKESPSRLDAGRKAFEAAGVKLKEFYMVMGHYDMVIVTEAPDDVTLARAILALASKGNVQTETLRAFSEGEYRS